MIVNATDRAATSLGVLGDVVFGDDLTVEGNLTVNRGLTVSDVATVNSFACTNGADIRLGLSVGFDMSPNAYGFITGCSAGIGNHVTVTGNLTVGGWISAKPFVSLRVATTGGTPSTGTSVATTGTPGTVSMSQYGFITNATVARGTPGTTTTSLRNKLCCDVQFPGQFISKSVSKCLVFRQ
jgi:hypothetical protein